MTELSIPDKFDHLAGFKGCFAFLVRKIKAGLFLKKLINNSFKNQKNINLYQNISKSIIYWLVLYFLLFGVMLFEVLIIII
jgi:hypothetical protein